MPRDGAQHGLTVLLKDASFAWEGDAESDKLAPFALHDITLDIPCGSLVAVVGSVGSGKSSLLSALIGGMRKTAGDSALFGSVAYCAQEPWILTGTIEENIVFGDDSVRARVPAAVAAACLDRDLEILPNGLGTQIGEKGINLSGGQKARVALARAIARDADIYLLDDPIAALDAHVGKKVFDEAICGVLRGKTVFLVTHQLHLLPKVDKVVVLDEGRVVETGAFRELMAREDGALAEIMKDYHFDDAEAEAAKVAGEDEKGEEKLFRSRTSGDVHVLFSRSGEELYWRPGAAHTFARCQQRLHPNPVGVVDCTCMELVGFPVFASLYWLERGIAAFYR
nr:Canalicular multispecific organic anion transporter 2 [Polyrhizophydium stewartii]